MVAVAGERSPCLSMPSTQGRPTYPAIIRHATPDGVRNPIWWTRNLVEGAVDVKIDWHGHNDRGLGVCNSIFAAEFGADRIHGTALGIEKGVGNAALDQILINFKLMGEIDNDLTRLVEWCEAVSKATEIPIPSSYPVMGDDAFRTATGVHAAAVIKAQRKEIIGWLIAFTLVYQLVSSARSKPSMSDT